MKNLDGIGNNFFDFAVGIEHNVLAFKDNINMLGTTCFMSATYHYYMFMHIKHTLVLYIKYVCSFSSQSTLNLKYILLHKF